MSTHNIGFYEDMTKINFQISSNMHLISSSGSRMDLGPVVQSIVSLTMLLRRHLVKYMLSTLSNTLLFSVGKM